MIPKIIHYCWFGGAPIPEEYNEYLKEWKQLNPDFELKLWNEDNFPLDNDYCQTALSHKNWANLSNFARLYALVMEGGIYLDLDFKLVRPLYGLLDNEFFVGFETEDDQGFWINNAAMGVSKDNALIIKCFNLFKEKYDGTEEANESSPVFITEFIKSEFPDIQYKEYQNEFIHVYPKDVFYPILYNERYKLLNIPEHITDQTVAVHIWGRSWFSIEKCLTIIDNLEYSGKEQRDRIKYLENAVKDVDQLLQAGDQESIAAWLRAIEERGIVNPASRKVLEILLQQHSCNEEIRKISDLQQQIDSQIKQLVAYQNELSSLYHSLSGLFDQVNNQNKIILQLLEEQARNKTFEISLKNELNSVREKLDYYEGKISKNFLLTLFIKKG